MKFDCALYVVIVVGGVAAAIIGGDDAAKFLSPFLIWILKSGLALTSAAAGALKAFRSTSFSDWKAEKAAKNGNGNGNGHTDIIPKTP